MQDASIKLTEFSHGAGCGCKISPAILDRILLSQLPPINDPRLLVGNASKDDAAAYDLGDGRIILSTTDFFMPIVDDPFDFGRIAAANAISDIYAMGGEPLMAVAILGWPVNTLPAEIAQRVVEGGRHTCHEAGIMLAGGHSIDAPEPIFGLAVTGSTTPAHLKRNDAAVPGSLLYLTKPLGVGVLTTAQKQKKLQPQHAHLALEQMCALNRVGAEAARLTEVCAMTDVTGFGLMGHLLEMCEGSGLKAQLNYAAIPRLPPVLDYIQQGCVPGGARRNFDSYGARLGEMTEEQRLLLCDPQTSGGLLIAVAPEGRDALERILKDAGIAPALIGTLQAYRDGPRIEVA
ncbi:selenide, water dikinase SelD [Hahella sp. HN01]|uniref:selenide, water dikinase SelD n=1 Tax=Hahella sp. HN01 TaxID=2847262 RepID=UPI001C1EA9F2|nr:selenide, water dikinase SelD [Hahella sp. HN01]MBU6950399.1 selenide, water dikinase SelD [Hahella sp. HN01]